jgi:formiminotetrahydrofolate cyclodeaminase
MLSSKALNKFLDELASSSPAPGGGSSAALAGAIGAALTSMVCRLTIGKKKYAANEDELKRVLEQSEKLREIFTELIDRDTEAFNKVMEALSLPKDNEGQKQMRAQAIEHSMKEATAVPLEVMKHVVDAIALAKVVAAKGNANSASDAGVSALLLHAAMESAALNVRINLAGIKDAEFTGWKSEEIGSLIRTSEAELKEVQRLVDAAIGGRA